MFYLFSFTLRGCARILKGSFPNRSKSSFSGKYERNRYKFKFPKAPASATRAQPLSSGAMHDRIYGPICCTIHHYGAAFGRLQNSGGPPSAAPHCFGFHNGGWCHIWDHILSCMAPELNGCARVALAGALGNLNL